METPKRAILMDITADLVDVVMVQAAAYCSLAAVDDVGASL
jgi:hypothetical protein